MPDPVQTIEKLSEIGPGLKELARAVQGVSVEKLAAPLRAAYQTGFIDGALVAAVALLVVFLLFTRRHA